MDNETKLALIQIFIVGYVDEMKGSDADDLDEFDPDTAREIGEAALTYLSRMESYIDANYHKNPPHTRTEVYIAGREDYRLKAFAWMGRN